jgi:hypothetical protein
MRERKKLHSLWSSSLDGREWLASKPASSFERKEPRYARNEFLLGAKANLNAVEKRESSISAGSNNCIHFIYLFIYYLHTEQIESQ